MGTKYRALLITQTLLVTLSCSSLIGSQPEEIRVIVERNVPVPMRDGTILRADVYRPDHGGPYPVLVYRTPYGKVSLRVDWFVKSGYIVVNQDVRGRYASDGEWESLYRFQTHDAEDGYDTVEWAVRLPGSNGKVGTLGTSYPAFLQWRLAPLRPQSLVAMSACSFPAQIWDDDETCTIRPVKRLAWWADMATDMTHRENLPGVHTSWESSELWQKESQKWLNWLPWLELPNDFFGYETAALKDWLRHPHRDPWKLHECCRDITVPNLDVVGWYDCAHGDMVLFRTMVKEARTEVARKGSRIIIGPWDHFGAGSAYGDIDFGPDAVLYRSDVQLRWFDYWLKGVQNGVDKDAPVKIFVMGDNQWRDEQQWPLERAKDKILYATSDGRANTPSGNGRLVDVKPQFEGTDKYTYDSKDPVPTPYGTAYPRACDQRPLVKREDILVYQSELLTERLEITGNPVVELYASSSAPDTDWFVRLIDVHPDGLARDVSSGMMRARYRNGFTKPVFITPREVVKYTIRMSPTSNAFLPRHRIRLDITSSDFPNYDRNHNTAANQNADATLVVANQTIYHGGNRATQIILPWVLNPNEEEKLKIEQTKQNTQLLDAATDGDLERVKSLISNGVNVNGKDQGDRTALYLAAQNGHDKIVEFLLANGADVNIREKWLSRTAAEIAMDRGHMQIVELLISKGADISPLHLAIYLKDDAKAKSLIEGGADVNKRTPGGSTPLLKAIHRDLKDIAKLLIAKGADVNPGVPPGVAWYWSPLHSSAEKGYRDLVELLIVKGANVNRKDGDDCTPLHYALWEGHTDIAKFLVENGATSNNTLRRAVQAKDTKVLERLLDANMIDLDTQDSHGRTALYFAISGGFTNGAILLIDHGADANIKNNEGMTPLSMAVSMGNETVVERLLPKGMDVNQTDDLYGFTGLHYAARFGSTKVAEVLIAHGADITAKDKWAYEPIHWAAYHDRPEIIELLVAKGADVNVKTSSGQTPLELAIPRRNTAAIEVLRKHGAKGGEKSGTDTPVLQEIDQ